MTERGRIIAGYRLDEVIGEGGMGVVWAATQISLSRTVALKVVRPDLASDDEFRQRFIDEGKSAALVDDTNVVSVLDAGEEDGFLYLAMSLVEGVDLRSLIEHSGPIAPQDAVTVIVGAASGLEAVHAAGLVHRDIKPANILIRTRDSRAMLTDFGLARSSDASKVTRTGLVIGTLDYMAPEQIESGQVDGRADVFALGAVLYEMLTGEPPFTRESVPAQIHAHLNDPAPRPSDISKTLVPFDAVVRRALSKDPNERQQTAAQFADEVVAALGAEASVTEPFTTAVAELSPGLAKTRTHRRRPGKPRRATAGAAAQTTESSVPEEPPKKWLVGLLAGIAVLAVAGLVAVALFRTGSQAENAPAVQPSVITPVPETVTVERAPQTNSDVSTAPATLDDWPGGSAYTVVLASVDSKGEAERRAREATNQGLDAGVLLSSDYSSLRPGYWVAFSGSFATQGEASSRASRAHDLGFADAYPRFVSP